MLGFRVGSLAQDAVTGIKVLVGAVSPTNYDALDTPDTVPYQVPGGKTFYITKITCGSGGANLDLTIGYGDNAKDNDVNPPTNWAKMAGSFFAPTANKMEEFNVFIPIPTGKYPHVFSGAQTILATIQGIEI